MVALFGILSALFLLLLFFVCFNSRIKFSPKLWLIYGKKRSGKSTLLCKIAVQLMSKGHPVYSTDPIKGTIPISIDTYYNYRYPKGSVILIDEIGIVHDNRGFKSFPIQARDWYKLQGHMGVMVVACSQTADIDLKIRNLVDYISIVRGLTGLVSVLRYYERRIVVARHGDGNGGNAKGSEIVDDVFPRSFTRGFLFTAGWRYWKYFDSYAVPDWPLDDRAMPPSPLKTKRKLLPRKAAEREPTTCPVRGEESDTETLVFDDEIPNIDPFMDEGRIY